MSSNNNTKHLKIDCNDMKSLYLLIKGVSRFNFILKLTVYSSHTCS